MIKEEVKRRRTTQCPLQPILPLSTISIYLCVDGLLKLEGPVLCRIVERISLFSLASRTENNKVVGLELDLILALVERGPGERVLSVGIKVEPKTRSVLLIRAGECHARGCGSAVTGDLDVEAGHVKLRTSAGELKAGASTLDKVESNDL
jgi:hypothetical protein